MTREEFLTRIEAVDRQLSGQRVPLSRRWIDAFRALAPNYKGPWFGYGVDPKSYPEYVGPNLLEHISDWYDERYGSRMHVGNLGSVPLVVRDEIYLFRIPIAFGNFSITIDHVLERLSNVTPHLAKALTLPEKWQFMHSWLRGYELTYDLEQFRMHLDTTGGKALPDAVRALFTRIVEDRESAIACFDFPARLTSASFHGQQMGEKGLKALLLARGQSSAQQLRKEFRHNVSKLFNAAKAIAPALAIFEQEAVILNNLKMDVRYEDAHLRPSDAVRVFWAGLRIASRCCCEIGGLRSRLGNSSPYLKQGKADFPTLAASRTDPG
jgi:hypothetical protein